MPTRLGPRSIVVTQVVLGWVKGLRELHVLHVVAAHAAATPKTPALEGIITPSAAAPVASSSVHPVGHALLLLLLRLLLTSILQSTATQLKTLCLCPIALSKVFRGRGVNDETTLFQMIKSNAVSGSEVSHQSTVNPQCADGCMA